jgi:hypothetical protein
MSQVTQRGDRPYTALRGLRRALAYHAEFLREIERRQPTASLT